MEDAAKIKSKAFALRIINLYKYLCNEQKEYILSKQILRSGTAIGANLAEARRAISQNGVAVNDAKVTDVFAKFTKDDITGEDFIVRRGKKNFRKIVVE